MQIPFMLLLSYLANDFCRRQSQALAEPWTEPLDGGGGTGRPRSGLLPQSQSRRKINPAWQPPGSAYLWPHESLCPLWRFPKGKNVAIRRNVAICMKSRRRGILKNSSIIYINAYINVLMSTAQIFVGTWQFVSVIHLITKQEFYNNQRFSPDCWLKLVSLLSF